jgi:hypothetical protein
MPTVKELIVIARREGVKYTGLRKVALERALAAHFGATSRRTASPKRSTINFPEDVRRHFDCDQEYALTGTVPIDRYKSRLEAAKNGHFSCVRMMDEKGIGVPTRVFKLHDENMKILDYAFEYNDDNFITWALRTGRYDRFAFEPKNTPNRDIRRSRLRSGLQRKR